MKTVRCPSICIILKSLSVCCMEWRVLLCLFCAMVLKFSWCGSTKGWLSKVEFEKLYNKILGETKDKYFDVANTDGDDHVTLAEWEVL